MDDKDRREIALFGEDQEVDVSAAMAVVDGTVAGMASHYLEIRRAKEDVERKLRDMNSALAAAELALINKMGEQGVSAIKVSDQGGGTAHLSSMAVTYYRLRGELEEIRAWLVEHGGSPLIKESVNWQSFESFCKELVEAGEVMPPQVSVTDRKVIRLRRDKPRAGGQILIDSPDLKE